GTAHDAATAGCSGRRRRSEDAFGRGAGETSGSSRGRELTRSASPRAERQGRVDGSLRERRGLEAAQELTGSKARYRHGRRAFVAFNRVVELWSVSAVEGRGVAPSRGKQRLQLSYIG